MILFLLTPVIPLKKCVITVCFSNDVRSGVNRTQKYIQQQQKKKILSWSKLNLRSTAASGRPRTRYFHLYKVFLQKTTRKVKKNQV